MTDTALPDSPAYASWDASAALSAPWRQATHLGTLVHLDEGATLYRQGEQHRNFYLLREGFVHTTILQGNGTPLLLEIFGPGAIFGEATAFAALPRSVTIHAASAATLSRYTPAEVEPAIYQQPELAAALLRLMGYKTHFLLRTLKRFASTEPQHRVVELLARVARLDGPPGGANTQVDLTHAQLASMLALSRVTVTRTLKALAQRGLIETESRRVVIRDRESLVAMLREL
ncbi:MAG: Crp/Fnr family transcriptional regulator [Proteobacteria bacterium]|jgi:CRP/FNR family cyclic AMP-dependent transcriptional regulator|nr:Crp/Fnr family transcriptional regulator [Ramlibacter sp.]MCA0211846.1 Crp/Fnr family transcriptional regulator [Pseudomonadota bacterium]